MSEKEKRVQPYNFKRPDRISKNQLRSLHFIHDRFARNFSSSVSAYLRTVVEVSLEEIVQTSYAEFLSSASDPTCYAAISMRPLDGLAALEVGPEIIFPIIDRLLGGTGRQIDTIRAMTEIEQSIVQTVLRVMIDNLKETWKPVYPLDFTLSTVETHPHIVQVVAPNEMIINFQFQIRMRQSVARMRLAFPTLMLEPIVHIFDQEWHARKRIIQDGMLVSQLRSVPVGMSIETAPTMFPMESLLSLQAGDTLVLDQRKDWPVVLKMAGKSKLYSVAKSDSSRRAFTVSGVCRPAKEDMSNATGTGF